MVSASAVPLGTTVPDGCGVEGVEGEGFDGLGLGVVRLGVLGAGAGEGSLTPGANVSPGAGEVSCGRSPSESVESVVVPVVSSFLAQPEIASDPANASKTSGVRMRFMWFLLGRAPTVFGAVSSFLRSILTDPGSIGRRVPGTQPEGRSESRAGRLGLTTV
jgi:hypothetical protein